MLAAADAILAEDTRVSRTLLARYGIETPLSPYHEHNAAEARPRALRRIAEGQALALISDAGTPLVSDPGFKLVAEAVAAGLRGHDRAGRFSGARRPLRRRPADRSLLLRGLFAAPQRGAARADQRACGGARRRWSSMRRRAASPRRSPISRANWADGLRRLRANLPSCTRRSGAARLDALAAEFAAAEAPRGEIVIVVGVAPSRAAVDSAALDREIVAALGSSVGQGRCGGRGGETWPAPPRGLCARARARWSGHDERAAPG